MRKLLPICLALLLLLSSSTVYGWIWNDILLSGGAADQVRPQIAYSGQTHLLIVWESRENDASDIHGALLVSTQSTPIPIQICTVAGDQCNPVVAWDGTSYLVAWEDKRSGNFDIYATRINPNGNILDGSTSQGSGLAICNAANDQVHPAVIWNGQNYLLAFEDYRNNSGKIYSMRLSNTFQLLDGSPSTGGILVGGGTGHQVKPKVAWNGTNYLIVFEHHPNESTSDIYGCRISASGQSLNGTGFSIQEDEIIKLNPDLASDGEDFLVIWDAHASTGYADIVGIMVSGQGLLDPLGAFPIAETNLDQLTPSVNWNLNHYVVLWKDTRQGKADIYLVRLTASGYFLDSKTASDGVNLGIVGSSLRTSSADVILKSDTAEYLIVWEENRSNNYDIYYQRYQSVAPPLLSWTNETNYKTDGLHPDSGPSGTEFEFRVKYQNPNGRSPKKFQLWIDQDDDGVYFPNPQTSPSDIIMNMTQEPGTDYINGVIYKAKATINYAGDGKINYRFVFSDLTNEATGLPSKDHQIVLGNSSATLHWSTLTGYGSDGVYPDSAPGGTSFSFKVVYQDQENDPPTTTELWVDLNNNGEYETNEKLNMLAFDAKTMIEGRTYQASVTCLYLPESLEDDNNILSYQFHFLTNNQVVEGEPAGDHSFTITPYQSVPLLSWPDEDEFTHGVRLREETSSNSYEFWITYQDDDNDTPALAEVWIDKNTDGTFGTNEKFPMNAVYLSDYSVVDGKAYHYATSLPSPEDGVIRYKFVFSDGHNLATGQPFLNGSQMNLIPNVDAEVFLSWTNEEGYTSDGVEPNSGPGNSWFHFHVTYSNLNNFPPEKRELWIDENNDGQYQDTEKFDMEDLNPNDLNYQDGKIYAKDLQLTSLLFPANLSYTFIFQDSYLPAVGQPTTLSLEVILLDPNDPGSDPNTPVDPNSLADPNTSSNTNTIIRHEYNSSQGGCFISSLLSL